MWHLNIAQSQHGRELGVAATSETAPATATVDGFILAVAAAAEVIGA